ncbi:Crp/Fnr family transcriptional regulator [Fontisubflavum oceani]|uniref:Crp/Fnr family transcriptional regulator n=1 Tax=Fontisubflavum oceani TaxID=2978973 RepID=UPI0025B5FAF9|nr:Crp/Fnr family transcriptional regulator [Fontisubflavum oceani]WJY21601.1 Crp/Fnr family transcriptional regulator [Fontisubflavum oceani]
MQSTCGSAKAQTGGGHGQGGLIAVYDDGGPLHNLRRNARRVRAGHVLVQDGDEFDKVIVVIEGWLATSKSFEDGEQQIIDFILPGDILDPATADGLTVGVTLEAVTDALVSIIPASVWQTMLKTSPTLEDMVGHLWAATQARTSERLLRLGKGTAPMRIAFAILELSLRLRALGHDTDTAFHLPLTQKALGDYTGLSSVHVCRTMRRLVRHGVIETSDHIDIRIVDLQTLSEIAGIDVKRLQQEITPTAA